MLCHPGKVTVDHVGCMVLATPVVGSERAVGHAPDVEFLVADKDELASHARSTLSDERAWKGTGYWVSRGGPQWGHDSYLSTSFKAGCQDS